jgi:hypothetical protein
LPRFQEPKHAVESKLSIIQRRKLSYLFGFALRNGLFVTEQDGNWGPAGAINSNIYDL